MSAAEHLEEAERSEREAAQIAEGAPNRPGQDVPRAVAGVSDVSTSGGEPLTRPRWTSSLAPTMQQQMKADSLRREAAEHRTMAKNLLAAERRACQGLSQEDIDRGPFFYQRDIARVEPIKTREGEIKGARIEFASVPGLTVHWMERAIECAQARAAVLGYPRDYMRESPLMIPGVEATVQMKGTHVEVIMQARDRLTAIQVLGRSEALLRNRDEPAEDTAQSRTR